MTPEPLVSVSDALAWFEAERQVLIAAITQAADEGLDAHAWQLPWAVWLFFDREGYWHDQVAIQRIAIAATGRLGTGPGRRTPTGTWAARTGGWASWRRRVNCAPRRWTCTARSGTGLGRPARTTRSRCWPSSRAGSRRRWGMRAVAGAVPG